MREPTILTESLEETIEAVAEDRAPAHRWLIVLPYLLWGAALTYVLSFLDRGWLPSDEGTLAQAAERVLLGELPHRDFDGMYSGGLELFHALAFKLFGTQLISLRMAIFAVFLPTVPLLYRMGRRLGGPISASVAVLLAVAWGLPNYMSAMPSWYNLFLAIYGTAALFEFMEDGRKPWLLAAGLAVGLSIAVKTVGLYLLAAVLLTLIVHEQRLAASEAADSDEAPPHGRAFAVFVLCGLGLFALLVPVDFRTAVGAFRLLPFRPASARACRIRGGWGVRRQGARKGRKAFASVLRLDGTARARRGGSGTRAAAAVHRFRRPRVDFGPGGSPGRSIGWRYSFAIRRRSRRCGPWFRCWPPPQLVRGVARGGTGG